MNEKDKVERQIEMSMEALEMIASVEVLIEVKILTALLEKRAILREIEKLKGNQDEY